MKFIWPIILLLSLSAVSCRKNVIKPKEKRLPNATTKGRGIFACHIDEKTYIARRQDAVIYNKTDGYLNLSNEYRYMYFRLFVYEGLYSEGVYQFDSTGEDFYSTYPYTAKSTEFNELIITKLDLEEQIISGLFNLDVFGGWSGTNKREIRDGRFDLKMHVIE